MGCDGKEGAISSMLLTSYKLSFPSFTLNPANCKSSGLIIIWKSVSLLLH